MADSIVEIQHREFSSDFADILVTKDRQTAHRMLGTADVALCFARALVAKEFDVANTMLTDHMQKAWPASRLRQEFESMIRYSGGDENWPVVAEVVSGLDISGKWIGQEPEDIGWTYVAIEGRDYSEAVSVVVRQEPDRLAIREIDWGRP